MPVLFSTQNVAPESRRDAWRDVVRAQFSGLDLLDAAPALRAEVSASPLGPLARVVEIHGSPQRLRRRAKRDALAGTWNLLVQERGRCRVTYRGESLVLHDGRFVAIDGEHGFELDLPEDFRQTLVQLPRDLIVARVPQLLGLELHATSSGPGDRYLYQILRESLRVVQEVEGAQLTEVICAALPLAESLRPAERPSVMFVKARLLLERFAHEPELGPARLAGQLGASRRYVEKLFAAHGTSISRELRSIRLRHCARDLTSPLHAGRTIFAIAISHGFTSAAHFARVFREQFGETPAAYRRARIAR